MKISKYFIWLPYLTKIKVYPSSVYFEFKGGDLKIEWSRIHSIMIYGSSVDLPHDFLDKCSFYKIPIVLHRRNVVRAVFIAPCLSGDSEDILSKQICFRDNYKKRAYIAKRLLLAKFKSMSWLVPYRKDYLYGVSDIDKMVSFEAHHSRRYWKEYFGLLGSSSSRRDSDSDYKKVLDAISKFVSGVLLRWVVYHNLSPYHGFIHKPNDYPSLVYDLMEPYRGYFDRVAFGVFKKVSDAGIDKKRCLGLAIEEIKEFLDIKVYVSATRQVVKFKELLHGVVIALRSYLLGNTRRFVVPLPSKPKGGRPVNAGYKLYGGNAGITNFWPDTKELAYNFEKIFFVSDL
ncbi:MAG: hypothetical protein KatS3mg090_0607 [Patescibacteria group bacterium]|nr:MAG: hypothetical protein KatS3mg090_0607 [Patescibacteria group bacterium]